MTKSKSLKNVNLNSIKSEKNLKKTSCKKKIYVAKKKLDSLKVKNETSSDYVILVADNWHVE